MAGSKQPEKGDEGESLIYTSLSLLCRAIFALRLGCAFISISSRGLGKAHHSSGLLVSNLWHDHHDFAISVYPS